MTKKDDTYLDAFQLLCIETNNAMVENVTQLPYAQVRATLCDACESMIAAVYRHKSAPISSLLNSIYFEQIITSLGIDNAQKLKQFIHDLMPSDYLSITSEIFTEQVLQNFVSKCSYSMLYNMQKYTDNALVHLMIKNELRKHQSALYKLRRFIKTLSSGFGLK